MWCTNPKEDHDTCGITLQEAITVMSMNGIEVNAVLINVLKKKNLVLCITKFWGLTVKYVEGTTVFHM
jgi:hypothetical protein